jgi:hypothetical protein
MRLKVKPGLDCITLVVYLGIPPVSKLPLILGLFEKEKEKCCINLRQLSTLQELA